MTPTKSVQPAMHLEEVYKTVLKPRTKPLECFLPEVETNISQKTELKLPKSIPFTSPFDLKTISDDVHMPPAVPIFKEGDVVVAKAIQTTFIGAKISSGLKLVEIGTPGFLVKNGDSPKEDESTDLMVLETRGRKEIELHTYVNHVNAENKKNDDKIDKLKCEKELLQGKSRNDKANAIAKIMREKTTRNRRLRDRERFLI